VQKPWSTQPEEPEFDLTDEIEIDNSNDGSGFEEDDTPLNFDDSPDEEKETLPDSGVVRIDEDIDENERIEVLPPDELTEFDDEDANKEIEIPENGDMNTPDLSTQEDPNAE
jgi:hypothetical protein